MFGTDVRVLVNIMHCENALSDMRGSNAGISLGLGEASETGQKDTFPVLSVKITRIAAARSVTAVFGCHHSHY